MFDRLRSRRAAPVEEPVDGELSAQAAVHDMAEHFEDIPKPAGWTDQGWSDFWWLTGSCGKRSCEQIISESADCGGIVFTASHAWAQTVADAPQNLLHYIDGSWECVKPSHSVDAATVHECIRDVKSDKAPFESLVYNAAFGMASVGHANAFTYNVPPKPGELLPDRTDYYQTAAPGSIAPIKDKATGKVNGYSWTRSKRHGGTKLRISKVYEILWSDPKHDLDPLLIWKPACKWIELYDNMCALLDMQIAQNSLGGMMFVKGAKSGEKPKIVQRLEERLTERENGNTSVRPMVAAGSEAPEFIEFPNVQEVVFQALPVIVRQIGLLGPIEMGTLADGEVSGSHWAAAFRERHNLGRLVGTMRTRVDENFTRWALLPKLQELKSKGELESDPRDWMFGHDLDAIANRTDNLADVAVGVRMGTVSPRAHRRSLRLKESDAPTVEELELAKCMNGRSPSEIKDFFGDYDEDKSDPDRREIGAEVFGADPGPDTSGSVPAPVQRQAAAAADPYAGFKLHVVAPDPYEDAFAA